MYLWMVVGACNCRYSWPCTGMWHSCVCVCRLSQSAWILLTLFGPRSFPRYVFPSLAQSLPLSFPLSISPYLSPYSLSSHIEHIWCSLSLSFMHFNALHSVHAYNVLHSVHYCAVHVLSPVRGSYHSRGWCQTTYFSIPALNTAFFMPVGRACWQGNILPPQQKTTPFLSLHWPLSWEYQLWGWSRCLGSCSFCTTRQLSLSTWPMIAPNCLIHPSLLSLLLSILLPYDV